MAQLFDAISTLASQPNNTSNQSNAVSRLGTLEEVFAAFDKRLTPALRESIADIKGATFFDPALPVQIKAWLAENAITPAVVADRLRGLVETRRIYLSELERAEQGLIALGVRANEIAPGEAELAFLIPRPLFDNHLEELAKELNTINQILRQFTEVTVGHPEPVEVRQISSSDPTFILGLSVAAIAALGRSVTWLLENWKKAEEIKKLRSDAEQHGFSEEDLKIFDARVERTISEAIEKQTLKLIESSAVSDERRHELENGLRWAMESLLARIERGLRVEIHVLAPPPSEPEKDDGGYSDLQDISRKLQFHIMPGPPILHLPPPDAPVSGPKPSDQ